MPEPQQVKKQRKSSGRNSITVSNKERERSESATVGSSKRSETTNEASETSLRLKGAANEVSNKEPHKEPKKRGRKIKYTTDEERKEARRQQNRNYRERRREELIKLRRQNALLKELEKEKSLEQN